MPNTARSRDTTLSRANSWGKSKRSNRYVQTGIRHRVRPSTRAVRVSVSLLSASDCGDRSSRFKSAYEFPSERVRGD